MTKSHLMFRLAAVLLTAVNFIPIRTEAAPPPGFTIPEITLSPNKRFGVLVPDEKRYNAGEKNKLVESSTGRVLTLVTGEPGMEQMNHGGVLPTRWSADSSLLLWSVDGKWFPRTFVLIKLDGDKVRWQLDLLKSAQQEILARARKAAPKKYAAAKKENAGSGAYFPEGFTVDVKVDGEDGTPVALPLRLHVTLTSNPKGIEDYPKDAQIDATLEAEVGADGKLKVIRFRM